jgi:hypothetical protein
MLNLIADSPSDLLASRILSSSRHDTLDNDQHVSANGPGTAFVAIVLENHKLLLVIVALEKVSGSLQN